MRSTRRHGARRASLSSRGRLLTTFAPFGWFVALMLLANGVYLLDQQFVYPLQSSDAGLLFAAVMLATSLALFWAIWHPAKKQKERGQKPVGVGRSVPGIAGMSRIGYEVRAGGSRLQGYPGRYIDARLLIGPPQARGIAGK